jgi:hypothetical protein
MSCAFWPVFGLNTCLGIFNPPSREASEGRRDNKLVSVESRVVSPKSHLVSVQSHLISLQSQLEYVVVATESQLSHLMTDFFLMVSLGGLPPSGFVSSMELGQRGLVRNLLPSVATI